MAKIGVVLAHYHQEVVARVRWTLCEDFEVISAMEDGNQAVETQPRHFNGKEAMSSPDLHYATLKEATRFEHAKSP